MTEEFLDHGFVSLVDSMGDDHRILQSARVSTGGVGETAPERDRGLIRYLYKNKHMTPFEQVVFTFHAKVPGFVMKQYLRHRTFSTNEYSQRYSQVEEDYYIPKEWRVQGITNHQGSGEPFSKEASAEFDAAYDITMTEAFHIYEGMIDRGVAKEMARMVLPSSVYTEFYFTVDLRNLLHFLELRLHEHAQFEIREFAKAIYNLLKSHSGLSWTLEIFDEMIYLNWKVQEKLTDKIGIGRMISALDLLAND